MHIRLLLILLVTALFTSSGSLALAARDMTSTDLMGLRVGMSKGDVKRILNGLPGKNDVSEIESKTKLNGKTGSVCYVNFYDDKYMSITFFDTENGSFASRISLVYQGSSYNKTLLSQLLAQFGKPDHRVKEGKVVKMAWGGKADDGGGITPAKNIKTTLRLEEISGLQVTISLDSHRQ